MCWVHKYSSSKAYISSKGIWLYYWYVFGLNPDDRPEYASVQAILYLLVGHTIGDDWDHKAGARHADWITPILASYNSN